MILIIKNLNVCAEKKHILKDLNLTIKKNEIHAIMGPNGSGKSTLSKVLTGHPGYQITSGTLLFNKKNIADFSPEKRSHEGLFLAFQHPLEISGVTNYDFLQLLYNKKQRYTNKGELTPIEFLSFIKKKLFTLKIPLEFLYRDLNQGFSGGEKKRNEVLQLLLLEPKLIILDELDSGLDLDALKLACDVILKESSLNTSFLIITHYSRILSYLQPNFIHIFKNGKIVKTGGFELIQELEKSGYDSFNKE